MEKSHIPPLSSVYYAGTNFTLNEPQELPELPSRTIGSQTFPTWPRFPLKASQQEELRNNPLAACYAHDVGYRAQAGVIDIALEKPLATGFRQHRPAQVWLAGAENPVRRFVARMYDPLYYDNCCTDRFAIINQAVAIENEAYGILREHQGTHVPRFCGIFVTEISGSDNLKPRHIYVVLLEYIPGEDIRHLMENEASENTCDGHRAAIVDAAARLAYIFFPLGILPDDMMPRNIVRRTPDTPSTEDFCDSMRCPWRNRLHIDLAFPRSTTDHPYAPRVWMIDLEHVKFWEKRRTISYCRAWIRCCWNATWLTDEARKLLNLSR
ncbi:hypothetical protein FB451DRAFT_1556651 [Mycena latifolia]|nr:hypothetical protein FB451DRAFT_1556651 [Mycena latifolia]